MSERSNRVWLIIVPIAVLILVSSAIKNMERGNYSDVPYSNIELGDTPEESEEIRQEFQKIADLLEGVVTPLNYLSNGFWDWHQEDLEVQIKEIEGNLFLRKVSIEDKWAVLATKNEDYSTLVMVMFEQPCEEGSIIETNLTWADGTSRTLHCRNESILTHEMIFTGNVNSFRWVENFGGFKIDNDFSQWDFTPLDRAVTLSKAKVPDEAVSESRN